MAVNNLSPINTGSVASYISRKHSDKAAETAAANSRAAVAADNAAAAENTENTDKVDASAAKKNDAGIYNKNVGKHGNSHGSNAVEGFEAGKSALKIKNEGMRAYAQALISGTTYTPKSALAKSAYEAAEATSAKYGEKDYWGVDATAERIFTFGKTLAGDNPDTLAKMRSAFEKGYGQATKQLGKSNVGSVTTDTYKKVNELFDAYEKELKEKLANNTAPVTNTASPAGATGAASAAHVATS